MVLGLEAGLNLGAHYEGCATVLEDTLEIPLHQCVWNAAVGTMEKHRWPLQRLAYTKVPACQLEVFRDWFKGCLAGGCIFEFCHRYVR